MIWTDLHGIILGKAFKKVLGKSESGAMAFVRCLAPDVVEALAVDPKFAVPTGRYGASPMRTT